MNRYLEKFNKIIDEFEKETKEDKSIASSGYGLLNKVLIADEFDCYYCQDDNSLKMTPEQEEQVINIIEDFYLDTDDTTIVSCVRAVCRTMSQFENIFDFLGKYDTEYTKIYDEFVWNLTD